MPATINTQTFPDFTRNAEIRWRERFELFPKVAGILYDVEDVDVITGEESSFGYYSIAKEKGEGDDFAFLNVNQGYNKIWNVYEIGGETKITWKMRRGNKYREMDRSISNLAVSVAKRMEVDLTHRFTFAWDTSYTNLDGNTVDTTIGDGLALISNVHTVKGSATTFSNQVPNNPPLSKAGMEAAQKLFSSQMLDDNGELIFQNPDTLVITNNPVDVHIALQYLESVAAPLTVGSTSTANSNAGIYNVFRGLYDLVVLPYLATTAQGQHDSNKFRYWFLADLSMTDALLKVLQRPQFIPPTAYDGREFETMDWKYAAHAAYALCVVRAQWIVGSKGDNS